MYKAHINGNKIQSCKEHCINTAYYAKENVGTVGIDNTAYLCGLLHDVGKCTEEFKSYIEAASCGVDVARGSVIHTFAGVRMILSNYHSTYNSIIQEEWSANLTAELIAIAIGSHHGQFDVFNRNSESGFEHRMEKQPDYDKRAVNNFFLECAARSEIDELFKKSTQEIEKIYYKIIELTEESKEENKTEEILFYLGTLERFILSALMDGDRKDTAEFMSEGTVMFSDLIVQNVNEIWDDAIVNLTQRLNLFPDKTDIQRARRELSNSCEKFAEKPCGIYRLSLPTGSGKTLSSLRYALNHAKKYNKKRIIFAIPLLSILDQNADVIKDAIDCRNVILEHHSDIVLDEYSHDEYARRELLTETWDSPIIITTLVQLLNTMFDGKTSSVRRFHNLADSVIVIDEVQSVPAKMLSLFNLMLNFLSGICNATFLLCSATQPLFELNSHKLLVENSEVVSSEKMREYEDIFRRTEVKYIGELDSEEIKEKVEDYFLYYGSVLLICNTKKEAYELFSKVKCITESCIHLSTSMCKAHRRAVLEVMKQKLEKREPIICVSTQLIEAGVDVSFGAVIRIAAGIDNVAQAAGRANRNGEFEARSPVGVAFLKGENLSKLKEIKFTQDITGELISEFNKSPDDFEGDLISDSSVKYYYKTLFHKLNNIMHYTEYCADDCNLLDLLSYNQKFTPEDEDSVTMRQAFKTAGEKFEVFDNKQTSVIVPYGYGRNIINNILTGRFSLDLAWSKEVLREAEEYTVNLFDYQVKKLSENNAVYTDCNKTVLILIPDYYDKQLGVIFEEGDVSEWNTLIL